MKWIEAMRWLFADDKEKKLKIAVIVVRDVRAHDGSGRPATHNL